MMALWPLMMHHSRPIQQRTMLGLKGNLKSACPVSSSSIPGPLDPMIQPLLGIKLIPILSQASTSMPLIGPVNSPVSQVICPVIRSGSHPVSSMVIPLHRDCLVISPVSQVICPVIRSGSHPVSSMVLPLHRDCLVINPVSQVICPVIRSGSHPVSSMVRDCLVHSLVGHLPMLRSSKASDTGLRHSQTFSCSRAACSQGIHLKRAPLKKSPALLASAWLISRHESCQRSASALLLLHLPLIFRICCS